jgi:putative aldouronate transport system substrate-binding protein
MATDEGQGLVRQFLRGRISRREFVVRSLGLGVSAVTVTSVLAACGGDSEGDSGSKLSVKSGGPKTERNPDVIYPEGYVGPIASSKEKLSREKVTLRVLTVQNPQVGDWAKNEFTKWYEERTNVHVEWQVVPSEDAPTKINAMMAAGDVPDVFMLEWGTAFSPAQQLLYGSQGLFIPLNDIIDEYGVEIKRMFEDYPDARSLITATDDNIYTLPNLNDCYHCLGGLNRMWIYQPWLDELGLDMPQTTEEYEQVLKAFKDRDPNGNGQADEIPLMSDSESPLDQYFMGSFLYNPGEPWLVLNDGKLDVTFNKPEWREGLRYMNRLFEQGLIAKESFTQTAEQLQRIGNRQGDVILGASKAWYWGSFLTIDQSSEDARWNDYVTVPTLEGPDGTRTAGWNYYGSVFAGHYVVTNACKNPEVAVMWGDGLYELEATLRSVHGTLGKDVRWAKEGEIGINGKQAVWKQIVTWGTEEMNNHWWGQIGIQYRSNDYRLGEAVDPELPTFEKPLYEHTKEDYYPYRQDKSQQLPPLYMREDQAAQTGELATTINNHVNQMLARFTTGEADIDDNAEWNKYVSTLDRMGLANYVQIHQDAYDEKYGG